MSQRLLIFCLAWLFLPVIDAATNEPLRISVYATAGDVLRYLGTPEGCALVEQKLKPLKVSRLFLEGRRGDEYVAPAALSKIRDFFTQRGLHCAGGIATVPGRNFGTRQTGGLDWLRWESQKTQQDVRQFFVENAPVFDTLIVDDFFCTADASYELQSRRGIRPMGQYRRDLLVSLMNPLLLEPARAAHPGIQMIIKYPQWYDRFHLFGYDPLRMSIPFDQVWVGTEVRDPKTRRMGFVQPTEGYMNFRWLRSLAGLKVQGAWFDHIECTAQHFVDQAYQSVLAGARELTLFHLGDLMEDHAGDKLLVERWPELTDLSAKVQKHTPQGLAFYIPPNSISDENIYLADYLGMLGLPILPEAFYPTAARVAFLPVQAATDPETLGKAQHHLDRGATVVFTPAFIRAAGPKAKELAGAIVGPDCQPVKATKVTMNNREWPLAIPLDMDAAVVDKAGEVHLRAWTDDGHSYPLLTSRSAGPGRAMVLNVRTFAEPDFLAAKEWLLAPKPLGLPALPAELVQVLRTELLSPLKLDWQAPPGVALYLFEKAWCVYNFNDQPMPLRWAGKALELKAHQCLWSDAP